MNIELRRYRFRPDTIDGQIWIDGKKVCDCAENAHHCLEPDTYQVIVHKCQFHARKMPLVMIGTKEKLNARCNICKKPETVSINSTPHRGGEQGTSRMLITSGRSEGSQISSGDGGSKIGGGLLYCPMLCPGNGVYKRKDGAILVGTYLAPGCLIHPKSAFDALYERIRKNIERGNPVTLTINPLTH